MVARQADLFVHIFSMESAFTLFQGVHMCQSLKFGLYLLGIFFCLLVPTILKADVLNFMDLLGHARERSMVGAPISDSKSLTSCFLNPAAGMDAGKRGISFSHQIISEFARFEGISFRQFGRTGHSSIFGSLHYCDYGNLESVSLTGLQQMATAREYQIFLGSAWKWGSDFSCGIGGKYVSSKMSKSAASTFGMDLGFVYRFPKWEALHFSGSLQNLGMSVRYDQVKENVSSDFSLGAGLVLANERKLFLTYKSESGKNHQVLLAGEMVVMKFVRLSAGWRVLSQSDKLGLGLGLCGLPYGMEVDYGYEPVALGIHRHSISLGFGFASGKKEGSIVTDRGEKERLSVQELLERGIEKYDLGDVRGAMKDWETVLQRDAENDFAKRYLSIAQRMLERSASE